MTNQYEDKDEVTASDVGKGLLVIGAAVLLLGFLSLFPSEQASP